MNYSNIMRTAIVIALLSLFTAGASGDEMMGTSRGHDLDALWAQAQNTFDLKAHDAIVLLASRHETINEHGGRRTVIHTVIWIGTPPGLRDHADLRIPWNSEASSFKVHVLRTWREGKWWPHESTVSPTAVVETLPGAVATADDYTVMREAMLLHDGVELPCIMETAFEIDEHPAAAGYDGFFVMQQNDPAVKVEFKLTVPEGASLQLQGYNGAPVPDEAGGDGKAIHIVTMENLERLGSPRIADPGAYAPAVAWTTWESWAALKKAIMPNFDSAVDPGTALTDILTEEFRNEPSEAARARKAVALVNRLTRTVHYDSRYWAFSPRPASRTYETAYGHALDRAVLAAAMFRKAGLKAEPVYVSSGPSGVDEGIPGLSRFGEMKVCVHSETFRAIYDPAAGTLSEGPRAVFGRSAWKPASDEAPWSYPPADAAASSYDITMTLEPGDDGWTGTGYISADGIFCPYADMAGLGGESKSTIGAIAGSVLHNTEVTGYNPELFGKKKVTAGFEFTMKKADPDKQGRRGCEIGNPLGGIAEVLPADVHLYEAQRTSPVILPGAMSQTVKIRVKACKKSLVHLPEARSLENEAGSFTISVEMNEGWVTIERKLTLAGGTVGPEGWPNLRALLLEAEDKAGRMLLMK